jgi:Flp pilus assembly protein TadG
MFRRLSQPRTGKERGQALVLFVLLIFVLLGMVAIVVDVSYLWSNRLHMQRAADAAALAGAVHLPGRPGTATTVARAEAAKNGYRNGVNGYTVNPVQSAPGSRQLNVTISGPVNWTFAQVFNAVEPGKWNQTTVTVKSKAQYVLPVPMGSPDNYFGVGYLGVANTTANPATSTRSEGSFPSTVWTTPGNAGANDNNYALTSTNGAAQQWGTFGFDGTIPSSPPVAINGIRVSLTDVFLNGSGTATNCRVRVELSWNAGASWSTALTTNPLTTTTSADQDVPSTSGSSAWGPHAWTRSDLMNANFRVRLTWTDGTSSCASTRGVSLDDLDVVVDYSTSTTTTTQGVITAPDGSILQPRGFWGAMNSQGAPSVQGDAYMTKYDYRKSALNVASGTDPDAFYAPADYYNYGVEIPAGASGGELYIYDPGFCDIPQQYPNGARTGFGTGEFWTVGGTNGNATREPISAFFDLYDARGTPYNPDDDILIASSNDSFRQMAFQDHALYAAASATTSQPDCGSENWHHDWWKLGTGLSGGTSGNVYRLHTYSTDFGSLTDQDDSTGHNTFALWARASGGTPRIYGIGAMEAYIRLPGGLDTNFYLAQIEDVHAGKTLYIDLWDPGDTGDLSASLEILTPTSSGWAPTQFSYSASLGSSTGTSSCNTNASASTMSVVTSTGGGSSGSRFNGCWLTIEIQLPNTYVAPQDGWWKIRYAMGGSTSEFSTDLTTWQVGIKGSPVHLLP